MVLSLSAGNMAQINFTSICFSKSVELGILCLLLSFPNTSVSFSDKVFQHGRSITVIIRERQSFSSAMMEVSVLDCLSVSDTEFHKCSLRFRYLVIL